LKILIPQIIATAGTETFGSGTGKYENLVNLQLKAKSGGGAPAPEVFPNYPPGN
jgi:hypothetical protein